MATLNVLTNDSYEDDEYKVSGISASPKELTWHWSTWPSNLRRSVGISISLVIALIAIVLFLLEQDKDFTQKLEASTGRKLQAQTKLRESGQERDSIVKHLPLLRELGDRGIFGEEKRLEWVEHLRTIEKRWPGIAIRYNIAPQKLMPKEGSNGVVQPIPQGAKLPNGDPAKQFGVFSTDMKLTLQLLHEGDALAIFGELKAANLGLFTVRNCSMRRPNNSTAVDNPGDYGTPLIFDCSLNWTSMSAYIP